MRRQRACACYSTQTQHPKRHRHLELEHSTPTAVVHQSNPSLCHAVVSRLPETMHTETKHGALQELMELDKSSPYPFTTTLDDSVACLQQLQVRAACSTALLCTQLSCTQCCASAAMRASAAELGGALARSQPLYTASELPLSSS